MLFKYKSIILTSMIENYRNIINNIPPLELARVANVTRDMAQKYKSGYSLPTLKKAVLIEKEWNIPPRIWVELQNIKGDK